jgi:hypothetical protein
MTGTYDATTPVIPDVIPNTPSPHLLFQYTAHLDDHPATKSEQRTNISTPRTVLRKHLIVLIIPIASIPRTEPTSLHGLILIRQRINQMPLAFHEVYHVTASSALFATSLMRASCAVRPRLTETPKTKSAFAADPAMIETVGLFGFFAGLFTLLAVIRGWRFGRRIL